MVRHVGQRFAGTVDSRLLMGALDWICQGQLIELLVEMQVFVGFRRAKKFIQLLDSTLNSAITA